MRRILSSRHRLAVALGLLGVALGIAGAVLALRDGGTLPALDILAWRRWPPRSETIGAVLLVAVAAGIAVLDTLGSAMLRRDRTYWPVLRVDKAVNAAAWGALAIGVSAELYAQGSAGNIWLRVGIVGVVFLRSAWQVLLIRKRNRTPIFLGIDMTGTPIPSTDAEVERLTEEVRSLARHNALNVEQRRLLQEDLAANRARRGQTPREGGIE